MDYRTDAPPILRDFLVYHETIQGHSRRTVDEYIRSITASRKAEGVSEILMPGELEMRRFKETAETGYEVSAALAAELMQYAHNSGAAPQEADFAAFVASL